MDVGAGGRTRTCTGLRLDGMRRSTSVAGYPIRIPKTTYFGLNRPMAEADHEEGYQG